MYWQRAGKEVLDVLRERGTWVLAIALKSGDSSTIKLNLTLSGFGRQIGASEAKTSGLKTKRQLQRY